jgi:hypothetical protein
VDAVDATGALVLSVESVRVRPIERRALARLRGAAPLFDREWVAVPAVSRADAGRIVVLGDPATVGAPEPPTHLYHLGWSLARIGDHLGVNHTTVLSKLRERGTPETPRATRCDSSLEA